MTELDRLDRLIERLRSKGYRLTPQRLAILKILVESPLHPSAEQVYAQVKPIFPMTSLATVYKTVSLLKEMKEILEINLGDSGSRYDGLNPIPHAHLICVKCGQIIDSLEIDLHQIAARLSAQSGYDVINQRLDIFGLCPVCQQIQVPQV